MEINKNREQVITESTQNCGTQIIVKNGGFEIEIPAYYYEPAGNIGLTMAFTSKMPRDIQDEAFDYADFILNGGYYKALREKAKQNGWKRI